MVVGGEQTPRPPETDAPRDHSHDVWSVANMITLLRLLLVPVFLVVLLSQRPNADTIAFVIFVVAAGTDFLDGLVARSTHTVTEIGKTLDPLVDRALIAAAVIGLFLVGRLPLWIALVFVMRDLYLLAGMSYLESRGVKRPPVSWLGKITTAVVLTGFALLVLNEPMVPGLGIAEVPWLPGLGSAPAPFGIYLLYLGVAFSLAAAVQYTFQARSELRAAGEPRNRRRA